MSNEDVQKVCTFYMRCVRTMARVRWQQHIRNEVVLTRVGIKDPKTLLCQRVLEWTGHVRRMELDRLPRQIMCGRPTDGQKKEGGQTLAYLTVVDRMVKQHMPGLQGWWSSAADKETWNGLVFEGKKTKRRKSPKRRNSPIVDKSESEESVAKPQGTKCPNCGNTFRTPQGRALHQRRAKCTAETKAAPPMYSALI
eukprot:Selendium_serpulae@DN6517_c2_g1_i6.p2